MSQETVPTLFVYCDVLEHVVVGDVMALLLRIVDMIRKKIVRQNASDVTSHNEDVVHARLYPVRLGSC